jgi:hypothetical protein
MGTNECWFQVRCGRLFGSRLIFYTISYSLLSLVEKIGNRLTKIVIKNPKKPINPKEYFKLVISAIYPIIGGPIKNPKKLTLETVVNAILVGTSLFFPAVL